MWDRVQSIHSIRKYTKLRKLNLFIRPPRLRNTGLVSSGASLTSWVGDASLALVGHPSSDGITIKMPYGVDVLH